MINPYEDIYTLNNQYIVKFIKLTEDKQVIGGLELQIDTRYNRMHHASDYAEVMAVMEDDVIKVGDTLIVQYLVVEEKNNVGRDQTGYYQKCDRDQIFCVLRDNEIIMIDGFLLVKPEETDHSEYEEIDGLLLPKDETKGHETLARVTHIGNHVKSVKVGDRVKVHKSAQYPLTINGERYYRIRHDVGLLWRYKEREKG